MSFLGRLFGLRQTPIAQDDRISAFRTSLRLAATRRVTDARSVVANIMALEQTVGEISETTQQTLRIATALEEFVAQLAKYIDMQAVLYTEEKRLRRHVTAAASDKRVWPWEKEASPFLLLAFGVRAVDEAVTTASPSPLVAYCQRYHLQIEVPSRVLGAIQLPWEEFYPDLKDLLEKRREALELRRRVADEFAISAKEIERSDHPHTKNGPLPVSQGAGGASSVTADVPASAEASENATIVLQGRREDLESKRRLAQSRYYAIITMLLTAPFCVMILWWGRVEVGGISAATVLALYATPILGILPLTRARLRSLEQDIETTDFEIELRQSEVGVRELRAERILRINQLQLRRYYDLNLSHNVWVFALGILCIVLGLGVLVATMFLVLTLSTSIEEKAITAVVGIVGSMLTNYVAAIYLKMHAAASSSLEGFHARLVASEGLLLGNLVASRIDDDQLRWTTLSSLALQVAEVPSSPK